MIIGMNKKIFKQLCMNYNKEADKDLFELWQNNLRCYDEDEMQKAVAIIIAQDRYFPTLNRVLEVVKDVVSKERIDFNNEDYIKEKMQKYNIKPDWLDKEITNQEIDEETEKEFEDFNNFIQEFRSDNVKDDMNDFIEELRNE